MGAKTKSAISPRRAEDYPKWYQEVIKASEMAESSVVRGCMVIKPWGYAIWENIQAALDQMIKDTGHQNFYCPLFLPLSFLEKEAEHVAGFAKECAVVTHHRLEADKNGSLIPAGKLEEPLVLRPTSEAIVGDLYSKWIKSYRDLPLLLNQWANVVRWEMRPRLFLRTSEFLWQEGHTAHASKSEAIAETLKMLEVYRQISEDVLAMPVITGEKTATERFPGAENTYCIESMMQDKKALQAGTSHFLGQNFAKAFNIKYLTNLGSEDFVWTTSWGVSTRLIGGLIMTHSDDDGLVLPPKVAPKHVIILPLVHKEQDQGKILEYCEQLKSSLSEKIFAGKNLRVEIDLSDGRAGEKAWGWVKKGVPIRLEIGMQEVSKQTVFCGRRDKEYRDKVAIAKDQFINTVEQVLNEMQENLLARAYKFQQDNTKIISSEDEFFEFFDPKNSTAGGFACAPWSEDLASEEKIKQELKVTPRCMPEKFKNETGKCIFTGHDDARFTIFAKAY
jgi:prolyl-tRNA synthetase